MNRTCTLYLNCALVVTALFLLSGVAGAHSITPDTIRIDRVGGTALLTVEDDATCQAKITALVTNPLIASVNPDSGSGVKVVFTVTGEKEGATNILIGWKGFPAPDCIEDGGGTVHVIVCDVPKYNRILEMGSDLTKTFAFTTTTDCGWRVSASAAGGQISGMSVSPSTPLTVSSSAPATFRVTLDPAATGPYRIIDVELTSPSGERVTGTITVSRNSFISPPPANTAATPSAGTSLDPINTASGEFYMRKIVDLSLGGPLPLDFMRSYGSFMRLDGMTRNEVGVNWSHNFQWKLLREGNRAFIITNGGRYIPFGRAGTAWNLEGSNEAPFQLVESGAVFRFSDPRVQRIYQFDTTGLLRSISDGRGNMLVLEYDASSALTAVSDGLGRRISFTRDTLGQITRVSDGTRSVRFEYAGGLLVRAIDAVGNTTTYAYDGAHALKGLLASITGPEGNLVAAQTYDSRGRVVTQTTDDGLRSSLLYNTGETIITDPVGKTIRHRHNTRNALVEHTDQLGRSIRIGVNGAGQRELIVDRLGDSTRYGYHAASGRVSSVIYPDATKTELSYSSRLLNGLTFFDLTRMRAADGSTRTMTYDAGGNLTEMVDPAGGRWRYTYNARGQILTSVSPLGGTTTLTYNADGTLASSRDDAGNTTTYSYDALRRLTRIAGADAATLLFEYDANDRLTSVTDELGNRMALGYDRNGRLVSAVDPLGGDTRYRYDGLDRLTRITDPLGNSVGYAFDSLGRLSSIRDPLGRTGTFGYDAAGRLASQRNRDGFEQRQSVDAEGVVTGVTDPLGNRTLFSSDRLGRLTELTTPLGARVQYSYDAAGRVRELTDPLGERVGYTYDSLGFATQLDLPENITARYERNAVGGLSRVVDPTGNAWRYEYDRQGRRTSATDPLGNADAFEYDSRSRVRRMTFPGGMGTVEMTRDAAGAVTRLRFSDGTDLQYSYDALGRITSANGLTLAYDAAGRLTQSNGIALEYDSASRITAMTLAQGKRVSYAYDARGNVTEVRDWTGGVTRMGYDSAGRRTRIERPNGITTTTRHDAEGKPVEIRHGSAASIALSYNARGEITSATRTGLLRPTVTSASQSLAYDAASQISGGGYQYDAMGRLLQTPGRSFTWDLASRLASLRDGSRTISYSYDGVGNMTGRTEGATTRSFVWNLALGLPSISIERTGGSDTRYFVHTPGGELLYAIEGTGSARAFFHYNEMEGTILLSDNAGAITDRYAYTPYGVMAGHEGSSAMPFTFLGASGVMGEPGTDLYFARARVYDATAGRFISREPVEFLSPRLLNPYQYAVGNPLRYIDVNGLEPERPIDFRGVTETVEATTAETAPGRQITELPVTRRVQDLALAAPALIPPFTSRIPMKGCIITLSHNAVDRRVFARLDLPGSSTERRTELPNAIIDGIEPDRPSPTGVPAAAGTGFTFYMTLPRGNTGTSGLADGIFLNAGTFRYSNYAITVKPLAGGDYIVPPRYRQIPVSGGPASRLPGLSGAILPIILPPLANGTAALTPFNPDGFREATRIKGPESVDDDIDLAEPDIVQ